MTYHTCRDGGLSDPASRCVPVTPSDTEALPIEGRALIANTEGRVRVTTIGGDDVTLAVWAGVPLPVRVRKVWATGTTAEEIHVLA